MAFVKSHSNYVLKKRHQRTKDGTIYERDITTIGGLDQFAPGQIPIYKSGNFIITVNKEDNSSRHIMPIKWEENDNGSVWNMSIVDSYAEDDSSIEDSIVIKKDFYDLRDFAYYGSCAELVRGSISDIIKRFPGELYAPYTTEDESGTAVMSGVPVYYKDIYAIVQTPNPDGDLFPYNRLGYYEDETENLELFLLSNPFNIDIHTGHVSELEYTDPLKFFTNNGYKNYELIDISGNTKQIVNFKPIPPAISMLEYTTGEDGLSTVTNKSELDIVLTYLSGGESHVVTLGPDESISGLNTSSFSTVFELSNLRPLTNQNFVEVDGTTATVNTELSTDLKVDVESYKEEERDFDIVGANYILCEGDELGIVELTLDDGSIVEIYAFVGDEKKIVYLVEAENLGIHIRPLKKFHEDYMHSLSLFQSLLITDKTSPANKATFEIWEETDTGYNRYLRDFIFPMSEGGYNIGSTSMSYQNYINGLIKTAISYDEVYCDNLYRVMTHEAIKNLDWTFTRRVDDDYKEGGNKIANVLRLFGREFDEIKSYIDNIGHVNTITYDDQSNLPDYFLTDMLDLDGWDVKLVYPYDLSEYILDDGVKTPVTGSPSDESANTYDGKTLYRLFNQDTTSVFKPYTYEGQGINPCFPNGFYYNCSDCGNKSEYVRKPASAGTKFYSDECSKGILRRKIGVYLSDREYTVADVNNAFEKRLNLNSRYIWRHKGTIEGIEMLLSLFGMKSKRWCESLPDYKRKFFTVSNAEEPISDPVTPHKLGAPEATDASVMDCETKQLCECRYDFDITEYTSFANRIEDKWREEYQNYEIDWFNTTKLINYSTTTPENGFYIKYQGLPVAYRDVTVGNITKRYLYPYFDKNAELDGDPYFQMNGGWLLEKPFKFDNDNNILINNGYNTHKETMRGIKSVRDIGALLSIPGQSLTDGDIYYVSDIKEKICIVDGKTYKLRVDEDGNRYITVYVVDNSLLVGVTTFTYDVYVSVPNDGHNEGVRRYSLDDKEDGYPINIYLYDEGGEWNIKAFSAEWTIGTFALFEDGHYESGDTEEFTNYFRLNNVRYHTDLSEFGWTQLKKDDKDYYRLNCIVDYYKGNNPHTGKLRYDNGHEYFTYFQQLFKYPLENDLFDVRCFDNKDVILDAEKFGFSGLIDSDFCIKEYDNFLLTDSKIHYFGNYHDAGQSYVYTTDKKGEIGEYNIADMEPYASMNPQDGITHQIVNNKRVDLVFYLHFNMYSREGLKEVKYLEEVVIPYVTQMIPSTSILNVEYKEWH